MADGPLLLGPGHDAPAHVEDLAVNPAGLLAGQVDHHRGHIFGLSAHLKRGPGQPHLFPNLAGPVRHGGGHPGVGRGGNAVYGHPVAAQVQGRNPGKTGNGGLGRPVVGLAGVANKAAGGAEGYDPAVALLAHQHRGRLHHRKVALKVDPDDLIPLHLGLWPLFTWFLAGITIALITRRSRESVIPPLIASTLTYLLVLGLSIYVLPRVPGAMSWEVYLTALAKQIIIDGPLDFAFLFAFPLFTALISASFVEALTPKKQVYRVNRPRRFWEWSEEE